MYGNYFLLGVGLTELQRKKKKGNQSIQIEL